MVIFPVGRSKETSTKNGTVKLLKGLDCTVCYFCQHTIKSKKLKGYNAHRE